MINNNFPVSTSIKEVDSNPLQWWASNLNSFVPIPQTWRTMAKDAPYPGYSPRASLLKLPAVDEEGCLHIHSKKLTPETSPAEPMLPLVGTQWPACWWCPEVLFLPGDFPKASHLRCPLQFFQEASLFLISACLTSHLFSISYLSLSSLISVASPLILSSLISFNFI